jgi:hypothetical protein
MVKKMARKIVHIITMMLFNLVAFSAFANEYCVLKPQANIVLLKFDDMAGVTENWQKITDFLESNQIYASYGVIGDSLENDNPAYFAWLKERVHIGRIELWNHGYYRNFKTNQQLGVMGEFNGASAQAQAESIGNTQALANKKVGVNLRGFGPHNSAIDEKTYAEIAKFPEINYVWFYPPVGLANHSPFVFKRIANLEHPIFRPNFALFQNDYQKRPRELGYIALQGHPNMWKDKDFDEFIKIIHFLKNEKVQFCKPSQVLAIRKE